MVPFEPDDQDPASAETVSAARRLTGRRLGTTLEAKASDRFCVAFAAAADARPPAFGPEARPAAAPSTVVEFAAGPAAPRSLPGQLPPGLSEQVWGQAGAGRAEGLSAPEQAIAPLLRMASVRAARESFLRSVGPAREALQRTIAALELSARRAGSAEAMAGPPRLQTCWLNRTLRMAADPRALSEVAADPSVVRLDVPRRLEADQLELDVALVAAAALRDREGLTGTGVAVGVIDSEVALRHPAFQDRVIHRQNFTSEPFGTPADHGTAVAGFVGADAAEFRGMAPGCTISNYKVLATVPTFNGDDFDGALAIQQALEDGIRVVNCSWGAGPASDGTSREARACDTAWDLGLTVVKSAGNRGPGRSTLTTPADAEGVIAVGATDGPGEALADYSSRGPTEDGRQRPHLLAPGGSDTEGLISALVGGGFGDVGQGTSYAAPHVVGLLALLLEREPDLTPSEQRDRLLQTCTKVAGLDDDLQGAGLLAPERLL